MVGAAPVCCLYLDVHYLPELSMNFSRQFSFAELLAQLVEQPIPGLVEGAAYKTLTSIFFALPKDSRSCLIPVTTEQFMLMFRDLSTETWPFSLRRHLQ